jgi:ATP-dependent exoDNAse (exonuclease V) beta subunit
MRQVANSNQGSQENKELLRAFQNRNETNAESSGSGKTYVLSQIMLRMLELDRASATASVKAIAEFVQSTTHQRDPTSFQSFDEYLDFRAVDFRQM